MNELISSIPHSSSERVRRAYAPKVFGPDTPYRSRSLLLVELSSQLGQNHFETEKKKNERKGFGFGQAPYSTLKRSFNRFWPVFGNSNHFRKAQNTNFSQNKPRTKTFPFNSSLNFEDTLLQTTSSSSSSAD